MTYFIYLSSYLKKVMLTLHWEELREIAGLPLIFLMTESF